MFLKVLMVFVALASVQESNCLFESLQAFVKAFIAVVFGFIKGILVNIKLHTVEAKQEVDKARPNEATLKTELGKIIDGIKQLQLVIKGVITVSEGKISCFTTIEKKFATTITSLTRVKSDIGNKLTPAVKRAVLSNIDGINKLALELSTCVEHSIK